MAPGGLDSPVHRDEQVFQIAAVLALSDPPAARALLARVFPEGRPIKSEPTGRRDALFAVALADPQRAGELIDPKVAAARTSKDGLRGTGLVEMLQIVTAAAGEARTRMLGLYGGSFRDVLDDED
jgi:hypothetical protein